jgi:rhamnosyltransferase subunit B
VARIVLNTFGSFGDLHPYLALAIELRKRGHEALVATAEIYRPKIEEEGITFAPVRPNLGELFDRPDVIEKIWHPTRGSEFLIRDYIMPQLEGSFEDLRAACQKANLLITHTAGYAGPIVADLLKLPWLSVALQPAVFFSSYDRPVLPPAKWLRHLYPLGRWTFTLPVAFARRRVDGWAAPIRALRKRLGIAPPSGNPIMEGQFAPWGTLALFSPQFAQPQPDWPAKAHLTGFVFYDKLGPIPEGRKIARPSHPDLAAFIDAGPAPVVFTLGSSAVMQPGDFYRASLVAARNLGVRAIMLVGELKPEDIGRLDDSIFVGAYAPYSELFPRAAAIVHQGGIGTTAQALRAGRPMLVVPWSHDQPDNAERVRKLEVARVAWRQSYTHRTAEKQLRPLLENDGYSRRAEWIGDRIRRENGTAAACEVVEEVLRTGIPEAPVR